MNNQTTQKFSSMRESRHLSEYLRVLSKHRWLIISFLVITVALTMLATFLMKPVYEATATLVIDKEQTTSPLTGERYEYEDYRSQLLTFNTHFKLITSAPVLEKVVDRLKLDSLDREQALTVTGWREYVNKIVSNVKTLMKVEEAPLSPEERMTKLLEKLRKKIDIEQAFDTRLLKINVRDHDPEMAEKMSNALARSYIEYNIDTRLKSSENTLSWMTDQLYEMKKKLEDAEEEFLAFKQREKLFSIEEKQKMTSQKIQDINDAFIKARNQRLELDAKIKELERLIAAKGNTLQAQSLIKNETIDNLYNQLITAELERSRLSKVYKSMHPEIIQINTKIENTRVKLDEELRKQISNLKAERSILNSRERVLNKTVAEFESDALETSRKELKYTILERNVETNKKMYDTLLSKVKESNILGNAAVTNIRVGEEASTPLKPKEPRKLVNLLLSIVFGIFFGIGFSFFQEYLDRTIRTEEDVQQFLDLPILAVVPLADRRDLKTKEKPFSNPAKAL